jgi:hypothetical protein
MAESRGVGRLTRSCVSSHGFSQFMSRGGCQRTRGLICRARARPWLSRLIDWLVQVMDQWSEMLVYAVEMLLCLEGEATTLLVENHFLCYFKIVIDDFF